MLTFFFVQNDSSAGGNTFFITIYSVHAAREILAAEATKNFKTKYFRSGRKKNRSTVNTCTLNSGFGCLSVPSSITRTTDKKSQLF